MSGFRYSKDSASTCCERKGVSGGPLLFRMGYHPEEGLIGSKMLIQTGVLADRPLAQLFG
jgi:hypothetical protein